MLAHRGYKVVVVNMWQWRMLDSGGLYKASRDGGSGGSSAGGSVSSRTSGSESGAESSLEEYDGAFMSEQLLYLQSRLQAALGPAADAVLGGGRRPSGRPLPQQVELTGTSRRLPPQQRQQSTVGAGAAPVRRLFGGSQEGGPSETDLS
jgi:hypothetical protein